MDVNDQREKEKNRLKKANAEKVRLQGKIVADFRTNDISTSLVANSPFMGTRRVAGAVRWQKYR